MRSVDKGLAPRTYSAYKAARNDLTDRIGWICSYCEMPVKNMIEVEHIHPINRGGNELDWDNFLLACRYCNGVKNNLNPGRPGYFWPDKDNTTLAFQYSEKEIIEPHPSLGLVDSRIALITIDLMGLNRTPHSGNEPTDADSRWIARISAIGVINESYDDWLLEPTVVCARHIARTAIGHGFYSFWMLKFAGIPEVVNEINLAFKGTYLPQSDIYGNKILRTGGTF